MPLAGRLRRLLGVSLAVATLAATSLGLSGAAAAQSGGPAATGAADAYRVDQLARRCAEAQPDFCYGFIIGTGQLYQRLTYSGAMRRWACAGELPSLEQIRQVFLDWVSAHPEAAEETAVDGFWRAMSERWPCKAK